MAEKENKFKSFFKKMSQDISDSNKEAKLEQTFRKEEGVKQYMLYTESNSAFSTSKTLYGTLDGNELTVYGEFKDDDIPYSSIISTVPQNADTELPKRYYVVSLEPSEVEVTIEEADPNDKDKKVNNTYIKKATKITLDENVKQVRVIKVKETYYLVKEKESK